MLGLGGILETKLQVFPGENWVRGDSGTGGDYEAKPRLSDRGGGDSSGGTQVDSGIEVQVDPPAGQGGTDDDRFSGF